MKKTPTKQSINNDVLVTTIWGNIRSRIKYLTGAPWLPPAIYTIKEHELKYNETIAVALALTEEIERLHKRIDNIERHGNPFNI